MTAELANIVAGYAQIDQDNGATITQQIARYQSRLHQVKQLGVSPVDLVIEPLATDWQTTLPANNFRSGCAPIMALERAQQLIAQGHQAVIIRGEDPVKTGYQRQERHQLMAVYDQNYSIAQFYNDLANEFIEHQNIDSDEFLRLAQTLFDNHSRSHQLAQQQQRAHFPAPDAKWFNHVTPLFRGVDCANPLVDFSGRLLICSEQLVQQLKLEADVIAVTGVGLGLLELDETTALTQLAQYQHLNAAYQDACQQANLDLPQQLSANNVLLELYTCYPVVPLGFLINCDLVKSIAEVSEFLARHLVTITGGMNLARAPWNNPALNGLIAMYHQLSQGNEQYGLVHGNGGIGYRQGVAILAAR